MLWTTGDFHFFRLCFKVRPSAESLMWKLVLFKYKFWVIYMWKFCTRPHFETEAKGNSEMAHWTKSSIIIIIITVIIIVIITGAVFRVVLHCICLVSSKLPAKSLLHWAKDSSCENYHFPRPKPSSSWTSPITWRSLRNLHSFTKHFKLVRLRNSD